MTESESELVPIDDTLTILLGAGASAGCGDPDTASINADYVPPLVNELFAYRPGFNAIRAKYEGAIALSDEIRSRIGRGESLESVLGELARSPRRDIQRRSWELPLYLQDLIGEVSQHYVAGATKLDTMLLGISRSHFRKVLLLTVNYDTLLERAIGRVLEHEFRSLGDYNWTDDDDRKWALVKLHGSVTWGQRLRCEKVEAPWREMVRGLDQLDLDPAITVLRGYQGSSRSPDGHFHYPAIALPVADKRNFVCPDEHVRLAADMLKESSHLLVAGFSGLDLDVMELIAQAGQVLEARVVDWQGGAAKALGRFKRVNAAFDINPQTVVYDRGFCQFVVDRELHRFLGVPSPTVIQIEPARLGAA